MQNLIPEAKLWMKIAALMPRRQNPMILKTDRVLLLDSQTLSAAEMERRLSSLLGLSHATIPKFLLEISSLFRRSSFSSHAWNQIAFQLVLKTDNVMSEETTGWILRAGTLSSFNSQSSRRRNRVLSCSSPFCEACRFWGPLASIKRFFEPE